MIPRIPSGWSSRFMLAAFLVVAGVLLVSLSVGGVGWLLLVTGVVIAGVSYGRHLLRSDSASEEFDGDPYVEASRISDVARSELFMELLPSEVEGFPFVVSCTVSWLSPSDVTHGAGWTAVRGLVEKQVAAVTGMLSLGDPALVRDLVDRRLDRGISNKDTFKLSLSEIRVNDIDVRVSQDAAKGWAEVMKWRQAVQLADLKLTHLDKSVWTEPRHALLWHLARNDPDPARAVELVEPVRRLLRALDESGKPSTLDSVRVPGRSDAPAYVQIVEQLATEAGERAFLARDLSRLLIRSGKNSEAAELRKRFIEAPRRTANRSDGSRHSSGSIVDATADPGRSEEDSVEGRTQEGPHRS